MATARTAQRVLESRNVFDQISGFKLLDMPESSGQGIVDVNVGMLSCLINEDYYRIVIDR